MWTKIAILICLVGIAVVLTISLACPCGRTPGLYLTGEVVEEPVIDWAFVNREPLCQIEVQTWRPHSVNLNCMAASGVLYVSCSNCAGKAWSQVAAETGSGRIRVGERVYPVRMERVVDEVELDLAWRARLEKLKRENAPRPEHWWSFRLTSG